MQSLKSEKTRKSGLDLMSRQVELADLFLVLPSRLRHDQKRSILHIFAE